MEAMLNNDVEIKKRIKSKVIAFFMLTERLTATWTCAKKSKHFGNSKPSINLRQFYRLGASIQLDY